MKIALYGASGTIGSRIAAEALARGHEVTGITRSGSAPDGVRGRVGDLADGRDVASVAAQHDVVVSATGPSRTGGSHDEWLAAVQTLLESVGATRVVFVGGAGSLVTEDGTRLLDSPGFPPEYLPEARSGAAALQAFRGAPDGVDWTFFSPAPVIAPGRRTGRYTLGAESPVGEAISAEDYAVALVDELEEPRHRRARFTAAAA